MRASWVTIALLLVAVLARAESSEMGGAAESGEYGVISLLQEIRARQARLDLRERELDDRERAVSELEGTAGTRLTELEALASTVEERIAAWEESNGDSIGRLAKIYASMAPERAAPLLEQMDVELATQVVARMKHKQSASVLSLISKDRVLVMSRKVAHPLGMKPASAAELP